MTKSLRRGLGRFNVGQLRMRCHCQAQSGVAISRSHPKSPPGSRLPKSCKMSTRALRAALCFVSALCLAQPAAAAAPRREHTAPVAIVREWASRSAAPIGLLEDGDPVTVLAEAGEFYRIDCGGMEGYIAGELIDRKAGEGSYVNCEAESSEVQSFAYADQARSLQLRRSLLTLAREQLGKPYIYGGTGPRGFDCSGLVYYLYAAHGVHLHRTASQQLQDGIAVSLGSMQVGDLVFFRESWDPYPASHVGIYAGNGQIIHAGSRGIEYADLSDNYYVRNFLCVRRVIETDREHLRLLATAAFPFATR